MIAVRPDACYLGTTPVKEVRKGSTLVLAPRGNELWYKANERPSLDLRFAETKSLVDATTGTNLIDFTRASSGTYVDSEGVIRTATTNEPRFDHDPTTGESLGLLVEESRTNLLLRSEEFGTTWTTTNATVTANALSAPNGTNTADILLDNGSSGGHQIQQSATFALTAYTFSVYVKQVNPGSYAYMRFGAGAIWTNNTGIIVDLSNGSLVNSSGVTSYSIAVAGDGWFRISITSTPNNPGTGMPAQIGVTTQSNISSVDYTGNGTSGIYLWGAQLEAGSSPTSYIPTTDSAVTRAADVASISGSNFSSWYRQDEGTVFINAKAEAQSIFIVADDGTFSNRKPQIGTGAASEISPAYVTGGSVVANLGTGTPGGLTKVATTYAADNYAAARDGANLATDTSGALPASVNTFRIGAFHNGSQQLNGTIRRLTYWPQRLSNEILQVITQ